MKRFPDRTVDTMSDAIGLSSPSGRMSRRARQAAERHLCMRLFGKPEITLHDLKGPRPPPPTIAEKVAKLREYARMAGPRQAKKLLAEAESLEKEFSMSPKQLIETMNPPTLASFIADVQMLGTGAERYQLQAEREAKAMLVAIVGESDAEAMIQEFFEKAVAEER